MNEYYLDRHNGAGTHRKLCAQASGSFHLADCHRILRAQIEILAENVWFVLDELNPMACKYQHALFDNPEANYNAKKGRAILSASPHNGFICATDSLCIVDLTGLLNLRNPITHQLLMLNTLSTLRTVLVAALGNQ